MCVCCFLFERFLFLRLEPCSTKPDGKITLSGFPVCLGGSKGFKSLGLSKARCPLNFRGGSPLFGISLADPY